MKERKSNLDERQEQALLKIEHNGCWLAFWGLLIAMVVQLIVYGFDMKLLAGEWIVFMALCLYIWSSCLKQGIWDRQLKPDRKTNLLASLVAGLAFGAPAAVGGLKYELTLGERAALYYSNRSSYSAPTPGWRA